MTMSDAFKIPKVIHYCWLSGEPRPQVILDCMASWKRALPDYEFVCWDMSRFDVNSVPYVRDAVAARKWAFAADYIRLYALYTQGGIYLDSDVMVYKPFDAFLTHSAFTSIEFHPIEFYRDVKKKGLYSDFYLGCGLEAAVMGAEKGHPFFKACLDYYRTLRFENTPRAFETQIMPRILVKIAAEKFGFKYCPVFQKLENDFCIYPPDVFSGSREDSEIRYALHLGANTWGFEGGKASASQKVRSFFITFVKRQFPGLCARIKGKRVV
jgi:hypothetical protein